MTCRQLGFDGAVTAPKYEAFGQGAGMKWKNNLQCIGNETSITECRQGGWIPARFCNFPYYASSAMCNLQGKINAMILNLLVKN